MVRVINVPIGLLSKSVESDMLIADGPVFMPSRTHITSRTKKANPSKAELNYLRSLADNDKPITVEGSKWERK